MAQNEMDASGAQLANQSAFAAAKSEQTLMDQLLQGIGSVLEFFPAAERFDQWRLSRDASLDEWPGMVRKLLT
jgi:hypothetical protein